MCLIRSSDDFKSLYLLTTKLGPDSSDEVDIPEALLLLEAKVMTDPLDCLERLEILLAPPDFLSVV